MKTRRQDHAGGCTMLGRSRSHSKTSSASPCCTGKLAPHSSTSKKAALRLCSCPLLLNALYRLQSGVNPFDAAQLTSAPNRINNGIAICLLQKQSLCWQQTQIAERLWVPICWAAAGSCCRRCMRLVKSFPSKSDLFKSSMTERGIPTMVGWFVWWMGCGDPSNSRTGKENGVLNWSYIDRHISTAYVLQKNSKHTLLSTCINRSAGY